MSPEYNGPSSNKVVELDMDIRLEDIPNGPTCLVCGTPTTKAFVENTLSLGNETYVFHNAAGYQCPKDHTNYISTEAVMAAYAKVRQIIQSRWDQTSLRILNYRMLLMQQHR